jgi:hypothetical protein
VPSFTNDLFSVRALKRDGYKVVFGDATDELVTPGGSHVPFWDEPTYHLKVVARRMAHAEQVTHGREGTKASMSDAELLRARLGYCGEQRLRDTAKLCADVPAAIATAKLQPCGADLRGNARRTHSHSCAPDPGKFGWISYDMAGPYPETFPHRYRYLIVFHDLHTNIKFAYLMRSKDQAYEMTRRFLADSASMGKVERMHRVVPSGPLAPSSATCAACWLAATWARACGGLRRSLLSTS